MNRRTLSLINSSSEALLFYALLFVVLSSSAAFAQIRGLGTAIRPAWSGLGFSAEAFDQPGTALDGSALFKTYNGVPDTLEIYAFRVQFAYEEDDNSLTTGRGHFDSDADTSSANYSLDPQGSRASSAYWEKHFEFANNYFRKASNDQLVIEAEIFPKNSDAYQLDKYIIDYNRTQKRRDEKTAEYDDARAQDYLSFIRDAVLKANEGEDSPFRDSLSPSPNRHRVYMIIHAGASRLVDGGSLGTLGADTPGDFMDIFIPKDAFVYLADVENATADTNGIILNEPGADTLQEVMVLSETASQDGLNWGINGIMISQIARQIGMPNTYDVVRGYSRLGYFDLMDFAGSNAQNGFLPVMPSAWLRYYMGWAQVQELRPGEDGSADVDLEAAYSGSGTELVKIPLASREYLLIENRQRSRDADNNITLTFDTREITLPADSIHLLFQDSVCNDDGGDCKVNSKKGKGVLLDVSSMDAGLPASGLAVWHVNEWYISQFLKYGFVNAWAGDTLRDHQFGIALLEADGILTIGKEFKNALGQPTFDYGSGTDLLPHIQQRLKDGLSNGDSPEDFVQDTVQEINAFTYAGTNASNTGRTHIRIIAPIPDNANFSKTQSDFTGDSVRNVNASALPLKVQWGEITLGNSHWPVQVAPGNRSGALSFLNNPFAAEEQMLALGSQDGWLQALNAMGEPVLPRTDTLFHDARYDSVETLIPTPNSADSMAPHEVYPILKAGGTVLQTLAADSSVYSLILGSTAWGSGSSGASGSATSGTNGFLLRTVIHSDSTLDSSFVSLNGAVRTMMRTPDHTLWVLGDSLLWKVDATLGNLSEQRTPGNFDLSAMALCGDADQDNTADIAVVNARGQVSWRLSGSGEFTTPTEPLTLNNAPANQHWQIACADFMRHDYFETAGGPSGSGVEAFVLSGLGLGGFASPDSMELRNVRSWPRGALIGMQTYQDSSGIAVGDINGDGYPEIVFTGNSMLWAVDRRGIPLDGFPYRYTRGLPQGWLLGDGPWAPGVINSEPLITDVDGDDLPDLLSATPAGLVFAVNYKGKLVAEAGASLSDNGTLRENAEQYTGAVNMPAGGLSDWPLAAGEYAFFDSTRAPFIHLYLTEAQNSGGAELYAASHANIWGWTLPKSTLSPHSWSVPGGNSSHTRWFNSALLADPDNAGERAAISEFYFYPNPLRGPKASVRWTQEAPTIRGMIRFFDLAGNRVANFPLGAMGSGRQQLENLDLRHLGSDVYTIQLILDFKIGTSTIRKEAWDRLGILR